MPAGNSIAARTSFVVLSARKPGMRVRSLRPVRQAGSQGRQIRVPFSTDIRRFAPVYPKSKRWRRLYNGRSAVERAFSNAKDVLPLERHALRGKKAIELRALLAAITINVRVLMLRRRAESQAAAA